MRSREEKQLPS